MHVMVVGGAGFIGSHLVDRLLAEGDTIDVVDDLSSGTLANLADARAAGGDLKIHHLDAASREFLATVGIRRPEVIVHLGWAPPGRQTSDDLARAVHSTLNVLEAAHQHGVAKVVTTLPAGALYGEVAARDLPLKEAHPWTPIGATGVIARTVADLLATYRADHQVEFTALALANVYGPRQRRDGGVVAAFVAALADGEVPTLHGDGRQTRDLVFVDDAVDALMRATRRGSGLVVNIGTGQAVAVRDLWFALAGPDARRPTTAPDIDAGVSRMALSPTRARIHLAWEPWTDLATGLRAVRPERAADEA